MSAESLAGAQRWLLRAGVFVLPLAYSPATYDSYVLAKLLIARSLVLGLFVILMARFAVTRTLAWKRTPLDLPLLAFLASAAISSFFAENQNVAVFGTYTRYDGLLTLLTYAALFWLSVQSIADTPEARTLLRFVLAGGYLTAAIGIVQSLHDSIRDGALAPAFGSLGNPNVLGGYLALIIALACSELLDARSTASRVLLGNVAVVAAFAMLLTFSRSAWLGAAVGIVIVAVSHRRELARLAVLGAVFVGVAVILVAGSAVAGGGHLEQLLTARALTLFDPGAWAATRLNIWSDSLRLIASRPLTGYGPDNFGLVYPMFQTGDWGLAAGHIREPIDKAHAELLQVAATQGVLGVAALLLIVVGFARSFWSGRRLEGAAAAFAGWAAYEVALQFNFTALASAFPFWIFAAAAMVTWGATQAGPVARSQGVATTAALAVATAAAFIFAAAGAIVLPYVADTRLRAAVDYDFAGRPGAAEPLAARARSLLPRESVYAVEVANLAFEQNRWAEARVAYQAAADLGTFNPLVYRNLALADRNLGLLADARVAARKAVELDPYDPANQALLAEFGS